MTTKAALEELVADLGRVMPDHRAAAFGATYPVIRSWFQQPVSDGQAEAFQVVVGGRRQPYLSFSRVFRQPAGGGALQVWVTLDHWGAGAGGEQWPQCCWYGRDFADPEDLFAAVEASPLFRRAAVLDPWHLTVSCMPLGA